MNGIGLLVCDKKAGATNQELHWCLSNFDLNSVEVYRMVMRNSTRGTRASNSPPSNLMRVMARRSVL